jgi:hypothetical protein
LAKAGDASPGAHEDEPALDLSFLLGSSSPAPAEEFSVDPDSIEVPDDWMGDPDDYIDAEIERMRAEWASRPPPLDANRAAALELLAGVEIVDDDGAAWRVGPNGFERVAPEKATPAAEDAAAAEAPPASGSAGAGPEVVIGDASLELEAFEEGLRAAEAAEVVARRQELEERRQLGEKQQQHSASATATALSRLRDRVGSAGKRARASEDALLEESAKRSRVDSVVGNATSEKSNSDVNTAGDVSSDEDDSDFDAEAVVSWRGR